MARIGVSNSSPLIILKAAERLDLLHDAFDQVIVPEEVAAEIRDLPQEIVQVCRIEDRLLLRALMAMMDPGEAAAIALACETRDAVAVIDDKKGRSAARKMGIPVVGTIGLVMEAKLSGRIKAARPIFELLLAAGLFASDEVIRRALVEVGE